MVPRYNRQKVRRRIRTRKRQVTDISLAANKQLDRHIFRRWHNFKNAKRFAVGWVLLLTLLIMSSVIQTRTLSTYYQQVEPVKGGVYSEGVVGTFNNANPIYAVGGVDLSVSKLIFSPLLTYDDNNRLVGDLASSWQVTENGTVYIVRLKPGIKWHDGVPLTSEDVIFTYNTIKNPDAKSPLVSSWSSIKVEKVNANTVRFVLPTAYSPFLHSLTSGIIPKHLLQKVPVEQLRSIAFNTKSPVGSGPFMWKGVILDNQAPPTQTVQLAKNDNYHRGAPMLDGIAIRAYPNEDRLKVALAQRKVLTAAGLTMEDKNIEPRYVSSSYTLTVANMLFLNNSNPVLNQAKVRQALVRATDVPALVRSLGYPVIPVTSPLLKAQPGYSQDITQLRHDRAEAEKLLTEAGWLLPSTGTVRAKEGKQFVISLAYENSPEFSKIADLLQKQWASVGVSLIMDVSQNEDSRKYVDTHEYDVLLYGISIGADPDVYAYWHSSQANKASQIHLNLSEYKSGIADIALEAARSRDDPALRAAKYKPFLEAWKTDAPAIGLYQPRYLLLSNQKVYGQEHTQLNTPSDRFNNAGQWMILTERK